MASDDPNATLPHLSQVKGMRIEETEPGDSVVESTGQRILFTTTARDFSGSCKVAFSQAAALALSGLDTMSEFQQAHEGRAISFPHFGNCRIMRRVRHVAGGREVTRLTGFLSTQLWLQHPRSSYRGLPIPLTMSAWRS